MVFFLFLSDIIVSLGNTLLQIEWQREEKCHFSYYFHSAHPTGWAESISGNGVGMYVCASRLRRWSLFLLVGSTDPYNHTYYESFWWKQFKNHKRTHIQRQRTMTKTATKTNTQTKCLKRPTNAAFLKSSFLTHSKYDNRYPTLWSSCSRRPGHPGYPGYSVPFIQSVLQSKFWNWNLINICVGSELNPRVHVPLSMFDIGSVS